MPSPPRSLPPEEGWPTPWGPIRREVILQLLRFGVTGGVVFGVYTGGTLLLSGPIGMPIYAAIAVAYLVGVILNFTLQRHFVFLDRATFALPLRAQFLRYLIAGALLYGATSVAVSTLPGVIGTSQRVVFVIVVAPISLLSFTLVRTAIFHMPRSTGA